MSTTQPPTLRPPAFAGAPACDTPDRCRFVRNGPVRLTDENWQPIYNREGRVTNAQTEPGAMPMRCTTCGREFDHPL